MSPYRETAQRPAEYRHDPFMRVVRTLQKVLRFVSYRVIRPRCTACGVFRKKVARNRNLFSPWWYCGCADAFLGPKTLRIERCTCNASYASRCPVHKLVSS